MLTVQEYADLMGFNPSSVRRMCEKGRIPCQKVGGRWRISVEPPASGGNEKPSYTIPIDVISSGITELISTLSGIQQSLVELKKEGGNS